MQDGQQTALHTTLVGERAHAAYATNPTHPRQIVVKDIVKEFHTEVGVRRVLDGISFSVGVGQRIAILGRNGAGKSRGWRRGRHRRVVVWVGSAWSREEVQRGCGRGEGPGV